MFLYPAISTDSGFIIQIFAHAGKRETLSTMQLLVILRHLFHFTKPSAENTLLWRKNLLLSKLSRIKIDKLICFLTDNEDLIKQQPDATSSSDSGQNFLLHQDLQLTNFDSLKDTNQSSYKFLKAMSFWGLS
ncbi:hypothetical protein AVEN_7936-1 [Araneus ventricosus]|uniref:Uncharacterized protein n=1 Tax=Araneus ventricosus TaxID=182803 RepID=A0A4Y2D535_ARAVE|nr:hypothetical protein AVEN_7936-1 [Araneus ventricosus]